MKTARRLIILFLVISAWLYLPRDKPISVIATAEDTAPIYNTYDNAREASRSLGRMGGICTTTMAYAAGAQAMPVLTPCVTSTTAAPATFISGGVR